MSDTTSRLTIRNSLPSIFVAASLFVVEWVLMISDDYKWFPFNQNKVLTAFIGLATGLTWLALVLLAIGISRLLRRPSPFGLGTLFWLVVVILPTCSWLLSEVQHAWGVAIPRRSRSEDLNEITNPRQDPLGRPK